MYNIVLNYDLYLIIKTHHIKFITEHKLFRVTSAIFFVLILIIDALYSYYITPKPTDLHTWFALKHIPTTAMAILVIIYFLIYRIHVYASLIEIGLLFCMIGDILLMFYIPTIPGHNNPIFLIIGGTSFFVARVVMTLAFIVHPHKNNHRDRIQISLKKGVLVGILPFIYTSYMLIYFSINMQDKIKIGILSVYTIMMGIQLYCSFLRAKGFEEESIYPQIFGVVGTVFFTISDTLWFLNMMKHIPYIDIISISFYWLGMYFLAISVVRSSNTNQEKSDGIHYQPLSVV